MSLSDEKDYESLGTEVKEEENVDQWLMSYADMITLLLGFFAVLLSMSSFDQVKLEMFSQYFSNEPKKMTMSQLAAQIQKFANEENLIGQVEAKLTSRGVEISFKDKLMFDLGRTDLKEEAVPILTKISNLLKYQEISERKVLIEGHTDSLPIRSRAFPTNWELSSARAGMVVRFFLSQQLDPRRFQSSGYADTKPKNPETDRILGQPENRRVVVVITPDSYLSEQENLRKEWSVNGSTASLNENFSKYQTESVSVSIEKSKPSAKGAGVTSPAVPEEEASEAAAPAKPVEKAAKVKSAKQKKGKKSAAKPVNEEQPSVNPASKAAVSENPAAPAVLPVKAEKAVPAAAKKEKSSVTPAVKAAVSEKLAVPAALPVKAEKPAPSAAPNTPPSNTKTTSAEKGTQQVNKDIDVYYSAGNKYLSENKKDLALKEFEKVLEINPKHTMAAIKVKKLKQELGK